ncbi:histidine phosphatase family protein [Streptomyces subrutilus]|uniref:histidine phosphatase family protein n=1 Tax=Streptomyces subrutilus TaxID=36818 RepID=UPI00340BA4D8
MKTPLVRVRLVTLPLTPEARRGRFGHGAPAGAARTGLSGLDTGEWAGRTLDEVAERDPEGVRRWLCDPSYAPPGGESVDALVLRVGAHLDRLAPGTHRLPAEQAVVRAAVVHALRLPAAAFWRLDAPPDTVTTLTGRTGRWNLLLGRPETAAEDRGGEGAEGT